MKRAQERITSRKPIARTKESDMIVLRPAAIFAVDRGSLAKRRNFCYIEAGDVQLYRDAPLSGFLSCAVPRTTHKLLE